MSGRLQRMVKEHRNPHWRGETLTLLYGGSSEIVELQEGWHTCPPRFSNPQCVYAATYFRSEREWPRLDATRRPWPAKTSLCNPILHGSGCCQSAPVMPASERQQMDFDPVTWPW